MIFLYPSRDEELVPMEVVREQNNSSEEKCRVYGMGVIDVTTSCALHPLCKKSDRGLLFPTKSIISCRNRL